MGLYTSPQYGVLGGTPTLTDRALGYGDSAYPELWHKKVFDFVPCLGPTGGIAPDYSGYHTGGVLTNMDLTACWVQRPQAVSFGTGWAIQPAAASDDYIEYDDAGMWNTNDRRQLSIGIWMTRIGDVTTAAYITKGNDSPTNSMQFEVHQHVDTFQFEMGHATQQIRASTSDGYNTGIPGFGNGVPIFYLSAWGGTPRNTRCERYINGFGPRFDNFGSGSSVGSLLGTRGAIRLFNAQDSTTRSPDAYIFRITLWNRMITPEEVALLQANALADFVPIRHHYRRFTHTTVF